MILERTSTSKHAPRAQTAGELLDVARSPGASAKSAGQLGGGGRVRAQARRSEVGPDWGLCGGVASASEVYGNLIF